MRMEKLRQRTGAGKLTRSRWLTATTVVGIIEPALQPLSWLTGLVIALSRKALSTTACRSISVVLLAYLAGNSALRAQPATGAGSQLPVSSHLVPAMPSHVLGLLSVYGNRLYRPGNERVTLTGTYTDATSANSATLITEIPGKVRLAISGAQSKNLLFDGSQVTVNGASPAETDEDVLESLQSDAPETFFYAFQNRGGVRYLGARYQLEDKPGYKGPYYDIYLLVQPVAERPGSTVQQKLYYFDSITGQFAKSRYQIRRGGQIVQVETVFSNWTKVSDQSLPGRIERFENGKSIFSFAASVAQLSRAASDGTFSKP